VYKFITDIILGCKIPVSTKIEYSLIIHHGRGLVLNANTVSRKNVILKHNTTIGNKENLLGDDLGSPIIKKLKINYMKKQKILCILHRSPPVHGAAKVGNFIGESKKLNEEFDCRFITIKSSDTIGDIGKVNFKKFYLVAELYIKVLWMLLFFRPDKLYFTVSVSSIAFYRDLLISTLYKTYSYLTSLDIYYHYHTKGIERFVSSSSRNLKLTNFFVKDVNIVLLSPLLNGDFNKVTGYKKILYLANGVENNYTKEEFNEYIFNKNFENINILYLSNMIKSKGYFEVLKLASLNKNFHFHFAGGWQDKSNEKEFFEYIEKNSLKNIVTFHGFVNDEEKKKLFENTSVFIFPTRYENEAFPLSILEAFSYGLPVISTDEASIPFIIDDKSGIVIESLSNLLNAFNDAIDRFVNITSAQYCRKRYLDNFSLEQFEENLVRIFK
jgi:glycosyltransferase involved in cell wall biosynthesis